jgi:hypothetical protein
MTSLLRLAAESLDRVSNPAFGRGANEQAGERLAQAWDDDFDVRLRQEASQLRHASELPPHAWLWLFDWARSSDVDLDRELLFELCEQWSVASFQTVVIRHVIRTQYRGWQAPSPRLPREDWLAGLVRRATATDDRLPGSRHSRHAESLLMALLQVGDAPAIDAAQLLLNTAWTQQDELAAFFAGWLQTLESEERGVWESAFRGDEDVDPFGRDF